MNFLEKLMKSLPFNSSHLEVFFSAYISELLKQIHHIRSFNSAWSELACWTESNFCLTTVLAVIADCFQFKESMKCHFLIPWILVLPQSHGCRKAFTRAKRIWQKGSCTMDCQTSRWIVVNDDIWLSPVWAIAQFWERRLKLLKTHKVTNPGGEIFLLICTPIVDSQDVQMWAARFAKIRS